MQMNLYPGDVHLFSCWWLKETVKKMSLWFSCVRNYISRLLKKIMRPTVQRFAKKKIGKITFKHVIIVQWLATAFAAQKECLWCITKLGRPSWKITIIHLTNLEYKITFYKICITRKKKSNSNSSANPNLNAVEDYFSLSDKKPVFSIFRN